MNNLRVTELFYSLQGEGGRAGTANVFVRLQGCKTKEACYQLGIRCDTEFESGSEYSPDQLLREIEKMDTGASKNIIWTGGEPLDQLTTEHVQFFKDKGYYQALETSGLQPTEANFDYICLSPKVAEHVVAKNFKSVHELRYVRHKGQSIPEPKVEALYYCISPHSDGWTINDENLAHCIQLVKSNPKWRLSVQQHKQWKVL